MNLSLLEREEVCIKAFRQLDKARPAGAAVCKGLSGVWRQAGHGRR